MSPPPAQERQHRARIAELTSALATWSPAQGQALPWVLPSLREGVAADYAGAYLVGPTEIGWSLHFMHGAGPNAGAHEAAFRALVAREPPSRTFFSYDPLAIDAAQRNRALDMRELAHLEGRPGQPPAFYDKLFGAIRARGQHQLRVLLCHGPSALAWVGATRTEPFGQSEVSMLQRLAEPLRRRLLIERDVLAPGLRAALLDVALEAIGWPAFVVGPAGAIELTNAAGAELLARDRRAAREAIAAARHQPEGGAWSIAALAVDGWPARQLVVLRGPDPSQDERLSVARGRFHLSPAQARVLALVIEGWSNKEVARQLGCAVVTVENHVTELLRRAQARSRADLVRRFFLLR